MRYKQNNGECWGVQQIRECIRPKNVQWAHIHIVLEPPNFQEKPEILIFKG